MHDWLQIAIGLLIVGAVFWGIRANGQANPSSTGKLSRQIGKLFTELRKIENKVDQAASAADFESLSGELRRVEASAASAVVVLALEGKLNRMEERLQGHAETTAAKIDAVHAMARRTDEGIQRIEAILMKGALDR